MCPRNSVESEWLVSTQLVGSSNLYATNGTPPGVPIPPSALLLGSGLLGLVGIGWRRKKSQ